MNRQLERAERADRVLDRSAHVDDSLGGHVTQKFQGEVEVLGPDPLDLRFASLESFDDSAGGIQNLRRDLARDESSNRLHGA